MPRSATKRAQSACPKALNVHDATMVSCLRMSSWETLTVIVPPSPTRPTVPQVRVDRIAPRRPASLPEQSIAMATPRPPVRSLMAATGSLLPGSTISSAPSPFASSRRSATVSRAMTRAPMAFANWVALRPTGPWPKIAMVSEPVRFTRLRAP